MYVQNKTILKLNETMKLKPNRSLRLPWTPQREKTSGNLSCEEKSYELHVPHIYAVYITISLSNFVFTGVLYQFFDLADRVVVNNT